MPAMQSYKGRFEPTRFEDLTVTIDFRCHSACRFCIVQEGMNYFKGVPLEKFSQVVADNAKAPRYKRVTFTGGEVTLDHRLFDYVAVARESGSFEHIRVQTNGRLMANKAFAERLVDAGIDEYFVSLHGHDAETQDYISQRKGSFDEAIAGLEHLHAMADRGVVIMTNTVMTTLNAAVLPDIVETVRRFDPARMEFWNYLPMEDFGDERNLIATVEQLRAPLNSALGKARDYGINALVKYYPQCLLGEHADCMDNAQPDVVIVEDFYEIYPQFACMWEAKCGHSDTCLGLHHPYIEKFGWELEQLTPVPRTTPWREPEYGLALPTDDPHGRNLAAASHPDWASLVDGVAERTGTRLSDLLLDRRHCIFRYALGGDPEASVDIVLTTRTSERRALARTRSFNIHYRNVVNGGGNEQALREGVQAVIASVTQRDLGTLSLDERKGLVGPEAFRRQRDQRFDKVALERK